MWRDVARLTIFYVVGMLLGIWLFGFRAFKQGCLAANATNVAIEIGGEWRCLTPEQMKAVSK